jgi:hypothetical protein
LPKPSFRQVDSSQVCTQQVARQAVPGTCQSAAVLGQLTHLSCFFLQTSAVVFATSVLLVSVMLFHMLTANYITSVHALSAKGNTIQVLRAKDYRGAFHPAADAEVPALKHVMMTAFDMSPDVDPGRPDRFGRGDQQQQQQQLPHEPDLAAMLLRNALKGVEGAEAGSLHAASNASAPGGFVSQVPTQDGFSLQLA